tara:strand:+ start:2791 stop:3513 length:723 start_codon:yes stop_codon:yes gene_type:complete
MRILVLGHQGMLGHMVYDYLGKQNHMETENNCFRWPDNKFKEEIINFTGDVIVNCIGSIPQRKLEFDINFKLPIWLDRNAPCLVIHPGTDCEIDSDSYGVSKKKAFDYITKEGQSTKIIKTSIIGPELKTQCSLLEWFLNTKEKKVNGFTQCYWNGITTLQWSKVCYDIITKSKEEYGQVVLPSSKCISKFELLNIIREVYNVDTIVEPDSTKESNKCLVGNFEVPSIEKQLVELRRYNK